MKKILPPLRVLFLGLICFLVACENDLAEVNRFVDKNEVSIETAKGIEMLYSDSAKVRVKIISPTLLRHLDKRNPHQEFPDGIDVEFFGDRGGVTSRLTAKSALRYEKENKIIIRDSVVWVSKKNERLETEELIWEEEEDRVFTNKFVTIIREEEILYGYGFESNQDFTEYKINAIEGRIKAEQLKKEN
jgi:LPS export ABC transporter protein LptC